MLDLIPILPLDPMSVAMPMLTVMCYTGALGWECRSQPECLSIFKVVSCYERNFGDIHTPEYMKAIRLGHNPTPVKTKKDKK